MAQESFPLLRKNSLQLGDFGRENVSVWFVAPLALRDGLRQQGGIFFFIPYGPTLQALALTLRGIAAA
jgi:hypothetical protein